MITEREQELLTRTFKACQSPDYYTGMMALYISREHPERSIEFIIRQVDDLFNDYEKVYNELSEEETDDTTVET